jgi:nickel-dependent lactate racemase
MQKGIPLARQVCQVPVREKYRVMIASPGGFPKDINVYQAQKGLYHAAGITQPGGTMILAAACPEGSGSQHYEQWMVGKRSYEDVMRAFDEEGFRVGPHKAYLIARDASKFKLLFCSEIDRRTAKHLLLNLVDDFQNAVDQAIADLKPGDRVGVLPHAASTIPYLQSSLMDQ